MRGRLVNVAIPATAGNVNFHITPGNELRRWRLHRLYLTLTADANAATRNILIYTFLNTSGTIHGPALKGADTVAGETKRLAIGPYVLGTGATFVYEANVGLYMPLELENTHTLRITINNGLAGDSYSGNYVYEYFPAVA